MQDVYEILQQKQAELARVRKEIESLNIVASLLSDDGTSDETALSPDGSPGSSLGDRVSRLSDSVATNVDNLFSPSRSGLWNSLKRAR
jgi:hypothetical protein